MENQYHANLAYSVLCMKKAGLGNSFVDAAFTD